MKSIYSYITEKLFIKKNDEKSDINVLDGDIHNFESFVETLNDYFGTDAEIRHKPKAMFIKDNNTAFVNIKQYAEFKLDDYLLVAGDYDYGVIFQIFIKTKYGWERDKDDMIEISRHYLYSTSFLSWLQKYNVQRLCKIFNIKRG